MKHYITDEGHIINIEDLQTYAMWKIKELRAEEWNDERILNFEESEMWKSTAAACLATIKNDKKKMTAKRHSFKKTPMPTSPTCALKDDMKKTGLVKG